MEALKQLAYNALRLDENDIMFELMQFKKNKDFVIDLVQRRQLFEQGIDADNRIIGTYSPVTEVLSGGRKKAGTHYTLFDTGLFYSTFKVKNDDDGFLIEADGNAGKEEDIIEKYGINIIGLTDENKGVFAEHIKPQVVEAVKEELLYNIG